MKTTLKKILTGCLSLLLFSCLGDNNETLILPNVVYATPIKQVIPDTLLTDIEIYMPIYEGSTPPNIDGVYLVNPQTLVYTSNIHDTGNNFSDQTIKFTNQNRTTNIVTYASEIGTTAYDSSELVSISGTNENFTSYFIATGANSGINFKTSTVISGTMTIAGIQNYKMAFIMLEKGPDPTGKLMNVNEYRIFKDGNGLASNTTWDTPSNVKSYETSTNDVLTQYSIYQSSKNTDK